jgi:cytoskeletal protein RodZ
MAEADMTAVEVPSEDTADTAGTRLRRAREDAGLSLADIAARTRIPERHLTSIEQGDFAALPARTYAVGFSRTYARALGLDSEEIVAAVRSELGGAEPDSDSRPAATFEPGDPARVPSSGIVWLGVLAAIGVIIAGLLFWRSYYAPAASLPSLAPDEVTAPASDAASGAAPAAAQPQPSGAVVFTAQEAGLWVKFYDGAGNQLMQKQMALGETYTVPAEAQDPKVWTGRPEMLAITIGGQPVPKLSDVQTTMKDVPVSAAALLARAAPAPAPAPAGTVVPGTGAAPAPARLGQRQPQAPRRAASQRAQQERAVAAPLPSPVPVAAPVAAAPTPQASTVSP